MPLHIRFDGEIAVLSNLGRSMNDPRYPDAGREVAGLVDEGYRKFILELRDVGEVGPPLLGLLMTITRRVRGRGGEVVLAALSRALVRYFEEMLLEDYWEMFRDVDEAGGYFTRGGEEADRPP